MNYKITNFRVVNYFTYCCISTLLLINLSGFSQKESDREGPPVMEYQDDEYVNVSRDSQERSPAYKYFTTDFFTVQVNVDENGDNIVGDAGNEPSITFDPTNHNKIAIGWRQFGTISNNFRQAGYGYSTDGGQSWTFPGPFEPNVFRSDPVLRSDADGNIYYNSLTVSNNNDFWCDVFKSSDGGATWDEGTFAEGGDKQWMSVDNTSGIGSGNIYHYWSSASICPPHNFTRSVDGNQTYETCSSVDGGPYWGTTAINAEGQLYTCGFQGNQFVVSRSSNAQNPNQDVNWDMLTPVSLDGEIVGFGGYQCPNPVGLLGQTIIAIDSSETETDGNVYLLCSVDRYSTNDPCDVMFARSTNGGLSFEDPVRINDDPGLNAWQWFGTMSVAPNGRIDVVWLDTRDFPFSLLSKLYYSFSMDGGLTWSINEALSEQFNPHLGWPSQDKMGDYFDMYSDETGAHLAWAATFNGEQDVYYGHILDDMTSVNQRNIKSKSHLSQNFPNPFVEKTKIRFNVNENSMVSLNVFDLQGRVVKSLVNEKLPAGNHEVSLESTGMTEGMYYYSLEYNGIRETKKMLIK